MCNNSTNRNRSRFLNLQKTLGLYFHHFLSAKKTQEKRLRLKNNFFPDRNHKESKFLISFQKNLMMAKKFPLSKLPSSGRKTHQFHRIQSNKEVTLKYRETSFLYRKLQKLKFFLEMCFWKKVPKILSSIGNCIYPKKKRKVASYRRS